MHTSPLTYAPPSFLHPPLLSLTRPSIHVFGDSVSTVGALEQSADACGIRCSTAFLTALAHGRESLPCATREAPPLTEGPTAGLPTYDLV